MVSTDTVEESLDSFFTKLFKSSLAVVPAWSSSARRALSFCSRCCRCLSSRACSSLARCFLSSRSRCCAWISRAVSLLAAPADAAAALACGVGRSSRGRLQWTHPFRLYQSIEIVSFLCKQLQQPKNSLRLRGPLLCAHLLGSLVLCSYAIPQCEQKPDMAPGILRYAVHRNEDIPVRLPHAALAPNGGRRHSSQVRARHLRPQHITEFESREEEGSRNSAAF